jgi:hypothetical protein
MQNYLFPAGKFKRRRACGYPDQQAGRQHGHMNKRCALNVKVIAVAWDRTGK